MKKRYKILDKPLRNAGFSGIILMMFIVFYIYFSQFMTLFNIDRVLLIIMPIFYLIAIAILLIFFNYGFIILAKKYKCLLLLVIAWIGIISIVLIDILIIGYFFIKPVSAQLTSKELTSTIGYFIRTFLIFTITYGIYSILKGIGLIKIRKKAKYAKYAGIFNIIAGATYFIFIGFLILIVARIIEILMFIKASEKLEK